MLSHLFIGDGSLFLIGQLHQRADICAQIGLTANEQDACARTEIQDLSFPLWTKQDSVVVCLHNSELNLKKLLVLGGLEKGSMTIKLSTEAITFFKLLSTVSGRLMSKHSKTASESL